MISLKIQQPDSPPIAFYCLWHKDRLRDPASAQDPATFAAWLADARRPPPSCTEWRHFSESALWLAVRGEAGLHETQATACGLAGYSYAPTPSVRGPWPPTSAMWRDLYARLETVGDRPTGLAVVAGAAPRSQSPTPPISPPLTDEAVPF